MFSGGYSKFCMLRDLIDWPLQFLELLLPNSIWAEPVFCLLISKFSKVIISSNFLVSLSFRVWRLVGARWFWFSLSACFLSRFLFFWGLGFSGLASTKFTTDTFDDSAQLRLVWIGLNLLTLFRKDTLLSDFLSVAFARAVEWAAVAAPPCGVGTGSEFLSFARLFLDKVCPETDCSPNSD